MECVEVADGFETTGGDRHLGGAQISRCSFESMCHAFDGDRVGIGQRRSDAGEHGVVPIEKQADELSEQLTVAADILVHFGRIKDASSRVTVDESRWFLPGPPHRAAWIPNVPGRSAVRLV